MIDSREALLARYQPQYQFGEHHAIASRVPASLRSFTPHWYLIRPVSGLIRKRLLKRIVQQVASAATAARA